MVLRPAKMFGKAEGNITFVNNWGLLAFRVFATIILNFGECFTPYIVFTRIIKEQANAVMAIFDLSPMPKKSMNNGKRAVAGIDLKKSTINSKL